MACNNIITANTEGVPYIPTTNVLVSDTAVNLALGFRPLSPVGLFVVRVTSAIPTGTTGTLPVSLTLNGTTRPLTYFGGAAVTVADLSGTGVLLVFNDKYNGILQLIQTAPAAAAATNGGGA